MKLALGTAQFGLDYGINNARGRVPADEVRAIIDLARERGVDTLDTAQDYGMSERAIGESLGGDEPAFRIVSKHSAKSPGSLAASLDASLGRLRQKALYGFLLHSYDTYVERPAVVDEMLALKRAGHAAKIGFSLYFPDAAEALLDKGVPLDLVQAPYSLFDQRFAGTFRRLRERGIEVHARSVFLQGLLFKEPEALAGRFAKLRDKIVLLRELSREAGLTPAALALGLALLEENIDRVVVGVDSIGHWREVLQAEEGAERVRPLRAALAELSETDEEIILPFRWR